MKSVYLAGAAVLATLFAVACSSDPDTLTNTGSRDRGTYQDDPQAGGNGTGTAGGGSDSTTDPNAPPPGIDSNEAKAFYLANVDKDLRGSCASCHATGNQGAPVFMDTDPSKTYAMLEARGYIVPNSMLLRKGSHEGPALTPDLQGKITQWFELEVKVRGNEAPVNIFSKLGDCVDPTLFEKINLNDLRTIRRDGENANTCTGCNQARCVTCHKEGEAGFSSSFGGLGTDTIDALKANGTSPEGVYLITKYVATNGTSLIPSTALKDKAAATKTDVPYGHPMFQINGDRDSALQAFAQDIITKYNAKTCGQQK